MNSVHHVHSLVMEAELLGDGIKRDLAMTTRDFDNGAHKVENAVAF